MALVSYGYDSESDENPEEEENPTSAVIIAESTNNRSHETKTIENNVEKKEQVLSSINSEVTNISEENRGDNISKQADIPNTTGSILSQLPKSQPTNQTVPNNTEDEIEDFIPKAPKVEKKKEKVKIMIPSLSEFKDDDSDNDEPLHKKAKQSAKGSGLLALLPPVKGEPLSTKSFVPQSVAQKNKTTEQKPVANKSLIPNAVRRKQLNTAAIAAKEKKPQNVRNEALESDDEDDIEIPETFDDEIWQKVCGRPKPKPITRDEIVDDTNDNTFVQQEVNIAPEPEKPYSGLDNTAFKELVGRKSKEENITIKDIHEDDIMPDKDIWMTKAITDPECAPKTVDEDPVDPTRRRKHHITYLAQQAKANEQELQNQWAANKFSRSQTRAKYGF